MVSQEVTHLALRGPEVVSPNAEEGRVPSVLAGTVYRHAVGGLEFGRAWEARRAHPSHKDSAAAPARRSSATSTWSRHDPGWGSGAA